MATPQSYTPVNDVTIPTHTPSDNGGTLIYGSLTSGVGGTEDKYTTNRDTSAEMVYEVTNLISIYCRASATGLALTPRAVMLKLKMILDDMLRQPVA